MNEFFSFLESKRKDLGKRHESFAAAFKYLHSLGRDHYTVVETGTARQPENWSGDGQSTVLFDKFVKSHGGTVFSLEINPEHIEKARRQVSEDVVFVEGDSVRSLRELEVDHIDLLYLDSYDLECSNPHPSSLHHLKELVSAIRLCRPHTLVMVDDSLNGKGKGAYVSSYMKDIGAEMLFDAYQIGFVLGR
jgi:predicted O-methyltransferase YrrM